MQQSLSRFCQGEELFAICDGDNTIIATHLLRFKTRSLVYLADQYRGFDFDVSHITPQGRSRQIEDTKVEVRSLCDYEEMMTHA